MTTRTLLSRFRGDAGANVATLFALSLVPALLTVGAAVDYARATSERTRLLQAIDATALSLAHESKSTPVATLQTKANAYFAAAFHSQQGGPLPRLTVTASNGRLSISTASSVPTAFMQIAGYNTMPIHAATEVAYGVRQMEIVLVLDNTGSMGQQGKMPALKTAATNFINSLAALNPAAGDIRVSIVPFDTQTRIDTANVGKPWLDLSQVNPARWDGCVIDRDQDYDTNANPGATYPARMCRTGALQRLVGLTDMSNAANVTALKSVVSGMTPSGNTNLTIGLSWGLSTLTPNSPVPGAQNFGTAGLDKFVVLLTDGDNTQNRFTNWSFAIDQRTRMACNTLKDPAKKLTVFTIRVIAGNASLLRDCATSPGHYFEAADAAGIQPAFDAILRSITQIRLTH